VATAPTAAATAAATATAAPTTTATRFGVYSAGTDAQRSCRCKRDECLAHHCFLLVVAKQHKLHNTTSSNYNTDIRQKAPVRASNI
jgi:hypothetical protein